MASLRWSQTGRRAHLRAAARSHSLHPAWALPISPAIVGNSENRTVLIGDDPQRDVAEPGVHAVLHGITEQLVCDTQQHVLQRRDTPLDRYGKVELLVGVGEEADPGSPNSRNRAGSNPGSRVMPNRASASVAENRIRRSVSAYRRRPAGVRRSSSCCAIWQRMRWRAFLIRWRSWRNESWSAAADALAPTKMDSC